MLMLSTYYVYNVFYLAGILYSTDHQLQSPLNKSKSEESKSYQQKKSLG
jgi:hypothetical protein